MVVGMPVAVRHLTVSRIFQVNVAVIIRINKASPLT